MVCRKILMVAGAEQGADEDNNFAGFVDYIANSVLSFPRAKNAIDRIRTIGNEANHEVQFVSSEYASEALEITHYLLETLYGLPAAGVDKENGEG